MKICTDIEQSSKLFEIGISIETADMCWEIDRTCFGIKAHNLVPFIRYNNKEKRELFQRDTELIPAWSLAALLEVLPQSINKYNEIERCHKIYHLNLFRSYYFCCSYSFIPSVNDDEEINLFCVGRDNWVDACYWMIVKLKENNLI